MNREAVLKVARELREDFSINDHRLELWADELEAACAIPKDWQLVPVEPTQEMLEAGDNAGFGTYTGTWVVTPARAYLAMLAAAPKVEP